MTTRKFLHGILLFFLFAFFLLCQARAELPTRFIVKYKRSVDIPKHASLLSIKGSTKKIRFWQAKQKLKSKQIKDLIKKFRDNPNVEYVEEDIILKASFEPGDADTTVDPGYAQQWHYFDPLSGINLPAAWDETLGSSNTVVAVVDTGIRDHIDLQGRILPGYDMITDITMANDGDGRDSDASDPGDWISSSDPCYYGQTYSSSWHGTHVAGTIAANSGNGIGVTGIDWNAKILPVRALGKCGGYTTDIADGIRWAAGGSVAGVPTNPNPAKVINLSLGGSGSCSQYMQSAITAAINLGAVVVVAAGNSDVNLNYNDVMPANCQGVVTVAATNQDLEKANYSNYGSRVDVAAPGGESGANVLSLGNSGSTTPASDSYVGMSGTSMSAPHVAGIISLMFAANPALFPLQMRYLLKDTTISFPLYSSCNASVCGSGLVDAAAAVLAAAVAVPDNSFVMGTDPVSRPPDNVDEVVHSEARGSGCSTVNVDANGNENYSFLFSLFGGLCIGMFSVRRWRVRPPFF